LKETQFRRAERGFGKRRKVGKGRKDRVGRF